MPEPEFIAGFHAIGKERYHHLHRFHLLMHEGKLTHGQLQAWALNRYYYQSHIPIKDAAILANCDDRAVRRNWVQRILDHDGYGDDPGGSNWKCGADSIGPDNLGCNYSEGPGRDQDFRWNLRRRVHSPEDGFPRRCVDLARRFRLAALDARHCEAYCL